MPPPGHTATTEPLSGVTTRLAGITEPATPAKQWCIRYLMRECGFTGTQANRMFAAYAASIATAERIGNDTGRSDEAFIDWLMRQAPNACYRRPVRKHEWKVTSA